MKNLEINRELNFVPTNEMMIEVANQNNSYDCGVAILENIESCILMSEKELQGCLNNDECIMINYNEEILEWKREKIIDITISLKSNPQCLQKSLCKYLKDKKNKMFNIIN